MLKFQSGISLQEPQPPRGYPGNPENCLSGDDKLKDQQRFIPIGLIARGAMGGRGRGGGRGGNNNAPNMGKHPDIQNALQG